MGPVAVRLHDQPLLHPAEVDYQAGNTQVYSGLWELMASAEPEKATLKLAPSLVYLSIRTSWQAEKICSPDGPTQFMSRGDGSEVGESAGR